MKKDAFRGITRAVVVASIAATAAMASGCYGGGGGAAGSHEQNVVPLEDALELFTPDGCGALEADPTLTVTRVPVAGAPDLAAVVVEGVLLCAGPADPGAPGSNGEDLDAHLHSWSGRLGKMSDPSPLATPRPEPDRPAAPTILVTPRPEPDVSYATRVAPVR